MRNLSIANVASRPCRPDHARDSVCIGVCLVCIGVCLFPVCLPCRPSPSVVNIRCTYVVIWELFQWGDASHSILSFVVLSKKVPDPSRRVGDHETLDSPCYCQPSVVNPRPARLAWAIGQARRSSIRARAADRRRFLRAMSRRFSRFAGRRLAFGCRAGQIGRAREGLTAGRGDLAADTLLDVRESPTGAGRCVSWG